jgi:hypothetical protein
VGFPAGYLLAWLARDELVAGRRWFLFLSAVSFLAAIVIVFIEFSLKFVIILSLFFIIIISQVAVWKSYDKRWVR